MLLFFFGWSHVLYYIVSCIVFFNLVRIIIEDGARLFFKGRLVLPLMRGVM